MTGLLRTHGIAGHTPRWVSAAQGDPQAPPPGPEHTAAVLVGAYVRQAPRVTEPLCEPGPGFELLWQVSGVTGQLTPHVERTSVPRRHIEDCPSKPCRSGGQGTRQSRICTQQLGPEPGL